MYIIMTHDLEDINFYGTEDKRLFAEAEACDDIQEWLWREGNESKLYDLGDDITGHTVEGFTYGLAY